MKSFFSSQSHVRWVLTIVLGAVSGVLATALTFTSLSDYTEQLRLQTRPLAFDAGPRAFPSTYAEAAKQFAENTMESVITVYQTSRKAAYGFGSESVLATGVAVTADGWVVVPSLPTIVATTDLSVRIKDGLYKVVREVKDPTTGAVFLKVDASNIPVISLGNGLGLTSGDQVFLAPHVYELASASVIGVELADEATHTSDVLDKRFILNTPLTSVSAPVFQLSGAFVGFAQSKDARVRLLPFEAVTQTWRAILEKREPVYATLGVTYIDLAHTIGIDESVRRGHGGGALLVGKTSVKKGSAAALAGLQEGDIITQVNGEELTHERGLSDVVGVSLPGQTLVLMIDRAGDVQRVEVVLGEQVK